MARKAILTVSTAALQRMQFLPGLPAGKLTAIERLPLGRANKVAFRLTEIEQDWRAALSGVLSVHFCRHGYPLAEVYLDAAVAGALEPRGPEAQIDFAANQLVSMYGSAIRRRMKTARASTWGTTPWIWGAYAAMTPGGGDPRGVLAEPLAERLFFAGEATHPHFFSTAHGAWESGWRAAGKAMRALSKR